MITTLTGSNSFLLRKELNNILSSFVQTHGELALEKIDGEEATFDKIRESLESLPFLASKKLVYLRAPSFIKEFIENAEKLLTNTPENIDVVIVEAKLDKRTAYFKYLQKNTTFSEFAELDVSSLGRWVCEEASESGGSISAIDANYLVARLGPSQQLIASELNKLLVTNKNIDKKLIDELVEPSPMSSIFDLLEAAFSGKYKRVIEIYKEQRKQNVEPVQIIALLAWQLHVLAVCAWADNKSSAEIAKIAKINPYVVQKSQVLAKKLTSQKIKKYINKLLQLDEASKTTSINTDDALQAYLLAIS